MEAVGLQFARDFTRSPYSDDEKRVVTWLDKIGGGMIGGGDDPIGFFMASYEMVIHERQEMKRQIAALQLDNDRLHALLINNQDKSEQAPDIDAIRSEAYSDGYRDGQRDTEDTMKGDA